MFDFETNEIEISTKKVVKNLQIFSHKKSFKLSDNYFDLVPNHPIKVKVLGGTLLSDISKFIKFRSYCQIFS